MAEYETPGPIEENWKDAISSVEETSAHAHVCPVPALP